MLVAEAKGWLTKVDDAITAVGAAPVTVSSILVQRRAVVLARQALTAEFASSPEHLRLTAGMCHAYLNSLKRQCRRIVADLDVAGPSATSPAARGESVGIPNSWVYTQVRARLLLR